MSRISGSPTLVHVDDVEAVVRFLKDVSQQPRRAYAVSLRQEHRNTDDTTMPARVCCLVSEHTTHFRSSTPLFSSAARSRADMVNGLFWT